MIEGFWFPAGSAKKIVAALSVSEGRFKVIVKHDEYMEGQFDELIVSSRVGNIPRKIQLPDQSVFETTDNEAVDRLLQLSSAIVKRRGWAHILETRWSWIGVSLLAVLLFVFAGFRWGLPWASVSVAESIPEPIVQQLSQGSLSLLDDIMFKPSEISESEQKKIAQRIQNRLAHLDGSNFPIHFRKMGLPNAIALPSGDIVLTDRLVNIASDEELLSVVLHEISHVKQKHGLQQLVRSSVLSFAIALVVGDSSGVEELLVGLPVFLMQSQYSRSHESEADEYALEQMMAMDVDPIHFARIMEKMEGATQQAGAQGNEDHNESDTSVTRQKKLTDYLSTHPVSAERIRKAETLSDTFNRR